MQSKELRIGIAGTEKIILKLILSLLSSNLGCQSLQKVNRVWFPNGGEFTLFNVLLKKMQLFLLLLQMQVSLRILQLNS